MKVKYIGSKTNSVTIGKEYIVLEIYSSMEKVFYRIIPDDGDFCPILEEAMSFEIIDSQPARNWIIDYDKDSGCLSFAPARWCKLGFWEDYSNFNKEAEQIFEAEKKIIFSQYPELCPPKPSYTPVIKIDAVGNMKNSPFVNQSIKIVGDQKMSGGYLLSIFSDPSNQANSQDEWFDTYEELEDYFKKHSLQVEWLDNNK
ncbi:MULTISPECIES: hypothetical protein [Cysteiniphilum]|uniref:Uncharacterized protein n=1 Tax=Cysteiniphilum litorale TaxID=2056700 RepID=A0A8J3E995_9GAMM|nr:MULTISPECIES: hypothetical protein [Cysteiniphilum]GGG05773.1 hypothetical protein GCM10010995_24100 [Cysteiniphilum litorale]